VLDAASGDADLPALDQSASDRVLSALRDEIIVGLLLPGTPLVEQDLSARLKVSRNTLREALRLLCREGLAVHQRHRGVVVRTLTRHDVRDIFRVRRTLELQAIARPEPLLDSAWDAMNAVVSQAEADAAAERWRSVGTQSLLFHQHIVHLLQSPLLDQFFRTILAQLRLVFAVVPDESDFQRPWIAKDRALLTLLRDGERVQAAAALTHYLASSEQSVLDYL